MPASSGKFSNNETIIYDYLRVEMGLNVAIACGILANIDEESRFNHNAEGDLDTSYGIIQWHDTRYGSLRNYCNNNGMSYRTIDGQLAFLKYEWNGSEKNARDKIIDTPDTAQGAYDAAYYFCTLFERPSGKESKGRYRGTLARDKYYAYYSIDKNDAEALTSAVWYAGKNIVDIALEQIGDEVSPGEVGPDKFDDAGLVYYSYNTAGYVIPSMDAEGYIKKYSVNSPKIYYSQVSPGDLVYYKDGGLGIAIGDGEVVGAWSNNSSVSRRSLYDPTPVNIVRVLSYSIPTAPEGSLIAPSLAPSTYSPAIIIDPYEEEILDNISKVESEGFDVGYLIAMDYRDREFRFYVPEFSESAGASWDDVHIIGRSASVLAYSHTSSRSITVSLDLYAGVGMYQETTLKEALDHLHDDANFLKSLEYPDYTNPITRPPVPVHLILGPSVDIVGVVSEVNIQHMKPLGPQNRSMYLKVSFKVTQIANNPPDWTDIMRG